MPARDGTGPQGTGPIGRGRGRGQGVGGRRQGRRANATKKCTCPKCGYTTDEKMGVPCTEFKCPKCETQLTGEFCA